ncbi:unnamed protein product [Rotaria magnacalcarata]
MASQTKELISKGNTAYSSGEIDEAIDLYTRALAIDENNHILYSNRSAAYAKLENYENAIKDAEQCIKIKPDFIKGYTRKASVLAFLKRYDDAIKVYEAGLAIDPNNQQIITELEAARKSAAEAPPNGFSFFADPLFINQLMSNPKAKELLKDPETAKLVKMMQENPENTSLLTNVKLIKLIGTVLGINGSSTENEVQINKKTHKKKETNSLKSSTNATKTPEQNQAEEEKEKGNEAYKKKDFETALNHYNKATELDPNNMTFYTNRAAVYFEQKRWDDCIHECEKAIDIGRENQADYKLIAKAYARMGNVKVQENNYHDSIKYYNRSLSEFRNPDILKKKQEIEKIVKEQERVAYINPELAEQEKAKGSEFFQKADYPNALKHYTEAIKRNPSDAKVYSNRAACFMKLMEFQFALKDCDEGIALDPTLLKCHLRKGHALMAMKDFSQAMSAFGKALEIDPNCPDAIEGFQQCSIRPSNNDPEEVLKRATTDPEIQAILSDPSMGLILQQMENEPQALHHHLRNPAIAHKIHKLIDCGIIDIRHG